MLDISDAGRFAVGDLVRVRMNPITPTINPRTPPYSLGHVATVIKTYGIVINPQDHHLPYKPLYTLQFEASEIWGPMASHVVVAEVHDEWLDPA